MMLRSVFAAWLFRGSRLPGVGPLVRAVFAWLAPLLPVRRVALTPAVIAFHHPRPHWATHVLLAPRAPLPGLMALQPATLPAVAALLALAAPLSEDLRRRVGPGVPLALIINGGGYQEVGQLHAHLVAGPTVPVYPAPLAGDGPRLSPRPELAVIDHPAPARMTHLLLSPAGRLVPAGDADLAAVARLAAVVVTLQREVRARGLEPGGFSLVIPADPAGGLDLSTLHLVAGPHWAPPGPPSLPPA